MIGSPHENDRQAATHSVWQRLGRAALTLGSGYQANRDALEPVLRTLADASWPTDHHDDRSAQKGTTR
jgi:hypothetical protein